MKTALYIFVALVLALGSFLVGTRYSGEESGSSSETQQGRRILYYLDPMNPAHTSDKPGTAPCGMPMEPVYADEGSLEAGASRGSLPPGVAKITPEKRQMIGVRIEKVERTSYQHTLRTLGRVAADENRTHRITAGADGWVWDVKASTTGSVVKKDQLMATVYNFQFLTRQQQYLYALDYEERRQKAAARVVAPQQPPAQQPGAHSHTDQESVMVQSRAQPVGQSPTPSVIPTTPGDYSASNTAVYSVRDQLEVARLELLSLGVGDYQIKEITRTRKLVPDIEIRAPVNGIVLSRNVSAEQRFEKGAELFVVADLARVWILADVFEREAKYIRTGMRGRVSLPQQDQVFEAVVLDVPPPYDAVTRTLKVRLETDNPGIVLRPDMFVDVEFLLTFPPAVNVPADAVLDTGMRKTVFVDLGDGHFEPRPVQTGWRFGNMVEITEGLKPDERIAVSGNFLIDSESRMKLAAAGLYGTPEKDVVCGMEVYPSKAKREGLTSDLEGKTHYFCSPECKDRFDKEHGLHVEKPEKKESYRSFVVPLPAKGDAKDGSVKDPVCGMVQDEKKAVAGLKSEFKGKTYYFCDESCKKRFDKNPGKYVK